MKQKPIELMYYYFGGKNGMDCCGTCCNLRVYQYNSKKVRKCVAYGGLHSTKADWAKRWAACGLYGKEVHQQMISNSAKQIFARIGICGEDNSPIEGQIGLDVLTDGRVEE